jgi:hypothetical protein
MSDALKLSDRICSVCGRALDDCGTCRCISPVLAHEAGLRAEARETEEHPVHPYQCRDCYRPTRSLEADGRCKRCSGEGDPEELHERARAASRQGHTNSARLLRRMATSHGETVARVLRDEARKLEAQADAIE